MSEPQVKTGIDQIRTLLVEDEPDVSNMMNKLLSSMHVDVKVANNAEEGLKILQLDQSFNLILCDLRMPGMGGWVCWMQSSRNGPNSLSGLYLLPEMR